MLSFRLEHGKQLICLINLEKYTHIGYVYVTVFDRLGRSKICLLFVGTLFIFRVNVFSQHYNYTIDILVSILVKPLVVAHSVSACQEISD